ncbi:MAG TPA: hypothetical protein DEG09_10905 [Marinilabiliaceae bacterium]|nr:hypothetical protein [Marinilabiliaceae bacterium]
MTKKKVTRVGDSSAAAPESKKSSFVASPESKSKARNLRIIAIIAWVIAIGCEVFAIIKLQEVPVSTAWLISLLVADLVFVVIGALLWKKANRLDPASKEDKFKFFVQNQLGLIIAIIAFLPLVILIFTNKNMDKKQKGLVGGIAVAALVIAGLFGVDFNPPSIEEYSEQTAEVEALNNGLNYVYWTKSGKSYHIFSDCSYINTDRTTEIFEGTVANARELKNITDLCNRCESRAIREKEALPEAETTEPAEVVEELIEEYTE